MIGDTTAAFLEIFSPPFRAVFWKVLALTTALLILATAVLHHALLALVHISYPWLQTVLSILAGLGLVAGSIFLVAPISAVVAGFFIDELAAKVEIDIDPAMPPGRPLTIGQSLWLGIRFGAVSLGITLLALALLLLPGINAVAFLAANTYLFGRQYFEFAALRFHDAPTVETMRRRHWGVVMLAGFLIAVFVSVPILNLLTPLFGTALMVRVHKRISAANGRGGALPAQGGASRLRL